MDQQTEIVEYAGFWIRFWASMVDTVLLGLLLFPLGFALFGSELSGGQARYFELQGWPAFFVNYVLPAALILLFWYRFGATPGKMLFKLRIVDARTGGKTSFRQDVIRYLGYFLSAFFLCLGFLWIAFDRRKQGWHDKLAGTVVTRPRRDHVLPVEFTGA
jgi:uncharacterized RDD family membrane protein YckC